MKSSYITIYPLATTQVDWGIVSAISRDLGVSIDIDKAPIKKQDPACLSILFETDLNQAARHLDLFNTLNEHILLSFLIICYKDMPEFEKFCQPLKVANKRIEDTQIYICTGNVVDWVSVLRLNKDTNYTYVFEKIKYYLKQFKYGQLVLKYLKD